MTLMNQLPIEQLRSSVEWCDCIINNKAVSMAFSYSVSKRLGRVEIIVDTKKHVNKLNKHNLT